MRFAHQKLERTLEWNSKNRVNELVVEAPELLRDIIKDFSAKEEECGFSFMEKEKKLKLDKDVEFIANPMKLDFNNRRVIANLLKGLLKTSLSEDYYLETNKYKTRIIKYLDKIIDAENFMFEVSSDDFSIDSIAKAVNLHIIDDEDDYVEFLTDYMAVMTELADSKVFVFRGLRGLMRDDEMRRFCENVKNHQFDVMLLEESTYERLECGDRIVIDSDLCEL